MSGPRVIVLGSINMDVVATTPRHPDLGETVLGSDLRFIPGGKGANQAVAAARLGATTEMVGRVGADDLGQTLIGFLSGEGVTVDRVLPSPGTPTGTALIVVGAGGDNTIVVVPGANATVTVGDVEAVDLRAGDVLVVQYEIPLPVVHAALAWAHSCHARTIVNPAPARPTPDGLLALADVVVVNESELAFLAGANAAPTAVGPIAPAATVDPLLCRAMTRQSDGLTPEDEEAGIEWPLPRVMTRGSGHSMPDGTVEAARRLRRRPDQVVVATLGAAGAVAVSGDGVTRVAGRPVDAVDSTGAGDCFVGALATALAAGDDLAAALRFANLAASISVQRVGAGTGMPTRAEVEAVAGGGP